MANNSGAAYRLGQLMQRLGFNRTVVAIGFIIFSCFTVWAVMGHAGGGEAGSMPQGTALTATTGRGPAGGETAAQKKARYLTIAHCDALVKQATKFGIVYRVGRQIPPVVEVGPRYYELPFDSRQGLARNINCLYTAATDGVVNFDLLDYRSHRVVGRWMYGKLEAGD